MSSTTHHCLNITSKPTPDPHITFAHGKYFLTFTANDRIPMWEAPSLLDFFHDESPPTIKGPIWRPPPDTNHSDRLWAPELHALNGRWYIYYAAQDAKLGNKSHRMFVLGGPPECENPHQAAKWEFLGPIKGLLDERQWGIDGTVFELKEDRRLYLVYSGWPIPPEREWGDFDEKVQQLFIVRLSNPTTAATEPVCISCPDQDWERTGPVGINEGPQWLESPDGKWRGLVYSCGASWTKEYKMATLRFLGGDLLDPKAWKKSRGPILKNVEHGEGPWGPGHGSFLQLGEKTVCLFHATDREDDGNRGRKGRLMILDWTGEDGGPMFEGGVVGRGTREVERLGLKAL